ncbi:MAG: pyrroloquinoline quinone biosynthesis protein PqqB [bacterium]|nr:pyrroloquinoline quinone biosynthesis protein PqqB [Deltaproteobacteria bacterium]MCP4908697.1 pyrroloquinoline quinone biosynthesis protein PqqB [bacterium]
MKILVLGSGAGGGFPQWNCNCPNCSGLRAGSIQACARTQSSLAVSDGSADWLLVNASPDLRAQLQISPVFQPGRAVRDTAIAAVLLVDAQVDHSTGLMTLREHTGRLPVYCTPSVHSDLTSGYPLLSVLEHYCGIDWHPVDAVGGVPFSIPEMPSIEIIAIPLPSEAPPYSPRRHKPAPDDTIGVGFLDRESGRRLFYAPGLGDWTTPVLAEAERADCILLDGTLWENDELVARGASDKTGQEMGHLSQNGAGGIVERLVQFKGRKILIHINNTNPILDENSPERKRLTEVGIEVAFDGMEIEL